MNSRIVTTLESLKEHSKRNRALLPISAVIRWSWVFYRQLKRDRAFSRSASMSYATLIALVPLLLLLFAVLDTSGLLDRNPETINALVFDTFLGEIPEVRDVLLPGLLSANLGTLGLVGIIGLLFVAARLYLMVERAYCDIFSVPLDRNLGRRMVNFYFSITAVPVVIGLTSLGLIDYSARWQMSGLQEGMSLALQFLLLFAALKLFPTTRVRWRAATLGASLSVLLLEFGRRGFSFYLLWFTSDNPLHIIYGSLALIPVFLIWLYLQWIFILLGVEVAYVTQEYTSLIEAELQQARSHNEFPTALSAQIAVQHAIDIARHFKQNGGAIERELLAEQNHLSIRDTAAVLNVLESAGIVIASQQGWLLARPASEIGLQSIAQDWHRLTDPRKDGAQRASTPLQGTLASAIAQLQAELESEPTESV